MCEGRRENRILLNAQLKTQNKIPCWLSRLRIQHCHCWSSDYCYGTGSNPGPGTSECCRHAQKKNKTKQKNPQKTEKERKTKIGTKNKGNTKKTVTNMVNVNPAISAITWKHNGLYVPIKR